MNRLTCIDKNKHFNNLKFDYDIFDVVKLEDNRNALITGYGVYDNQYWCEVCYSNGIHLGKGNWFSCNPLDRNKIVHRLDKKYKQKFLKAFIDALKEYPELYSKDINYLEMLLK